MDDQKKIFTWMVFGLLLAPLMSSMASEADEGDDPVVMSLDAQPKTQRGSRTQQPQFNEELTDENGESVADTRRFIDRLNANYFAILYGPSVGTPSSYQPTPYGEQDLARPLLVQNFLGMGYNVSDAVTVGASAYWLWQPVLTQTITIKDPFLRVAHNSIISTERFNLYADVRLHFAVTPFSRASDLLAGLQTFQVASYQVGTTRLSLGLFASARLNVYGPRGVGNDLELYLAPNLTYQLSPKVGFTLVYEMAANHEFGADPFELFSGGTDLEPGITWQVTPSLSVNPYLNIMTGGKISLDSTSLGALVSWQLL